MLKALILLTEIAPEKVVPIEVVMRHRVRMKGKVQHSENAEEKGMVKRMAEGLENMRVKTLLKKNPFESEEFQKARDIGHYHLDEFFDGVFAEAKYKEEESEEQDVK